VSRPAPAVEVLADEAAPALASRFLTRRTALSIFAAAAIVAVAVWRAPINWGDAWTRISHADPILYLCGLAAYYLSFVIRGVRWMILLGNAGEDRAVVPLTLILVTSFFINCVVPAKMGDLYRAYLGRVRQSISGTKALGTIIAERLVDLVVLMGLLLVAGAYVFHRHAPGALVPYYIAGTAVSLIGVAVILVMRAGRGQRLLRLLPEAIFHKYQGFRLGAVMSLNRYPALLMLTVTVWGLEATRLGFVVAALGFTAQVGPSQFLLIALVAALLTTVPFLPGGIGLVEAGMVGVLTLIGGVMKDDAVSIALLDRSISYGSLVLLGFAVFSVTHIHMPHHQRRRAEESAG